MAGDEDGGAAGSGIGDADGGAASPRGRAEAAPVVVDAHTHVACNDLDGFPARPTGVGSDWWRGADGRAGALVDVLDAHDVAAAVVVQAVGVYGHDCGCAAHVVASSSDRLALVASVGMEGPDPAAALAGLVADLAPTRVAGVRLFGVGADPTGWLHDARAREVWSVAGDLGLTVVPCVFSPDLDAVGQIADGRAEVPVAVDHCGFPDREGAEGWAAAHRLAGVDSVALKVTSYVLEAAERDDGDPAGAVDGLVERFGPGRLCWGSDHPQDLTHSYAGKLDLARRALRHLDAEDRARIMAGTARRLWFG